MTPESAWQKVRSDTDPLRWLVCQFEGDKFIVAQTNSTGFADFIAATKSTAQQSGIAVGGLRICAVDDRGSVKSIRSKFIRVTQMGDNVPPIQRARMQAQGPLLDKVFVGTHCKFDVSDVDELTKERITRKLQESAGAHLPNFYDFDGNEEASGRLSTSTRISSAILQGPASAAKPSPKHADIQGKNSLNEFPEAKPQKNENVELQMEKVEPEPPLAPVLLVEPEVAPAPKVDTEFAPKKTIEPVPAKEDQPKVNPIPISVQQSGPKPRKVNSLREGWANVQSETQPENFLVVECGKEGVAKAIIIACGQGSLKTFSTYFSNDRALMFGGFRVRAIDERGGVASVRTRMIFYSYIGPNTPPTVRARANTVRGEVEAMFSGCSLRINVDSSDEVADEAALLQKLNSTAAAHRPNRYDFSGCKSNDPSKTL